MRGAKMKLIIALILIAIMTPFLAFAETGVVNTTGATLYPTAALTPGNIAGPIAMDRSGRLPTPYDPGTTLSQSVIPLSQGATSVNGTATGVFGFRRRANDLAETGSTATVINATTHAAVVGDLIYFQDGVASEGSTFVTAVATNTITVSPALRAAPANGDSFVVGIPGPIGMTANVATAGLPVLHTTIARGDGSGAIGSASGAGFALKDEDSAHATTDAGIFALAVSNEDFSIRTSTNGDYSPISVGNTGVVATAAVEYGSTTAMARLGAVRPEDAALTTGDRLMLAGAQLQDPLSVDAAALDAGFLKTGLDGRLITTLAPAGETWSACSAAVTNTTPAAIKALVASNRIYMTTLTCHNNDDTATVVNIQDGSGGTTLYSLYLTTNILAVPTHTITFPTPIRSTSATGIFQVPVTTAANVVCCGSGYISVN